MVFNDPVPEQYYTPLLPLMRRFMFPHSYYQMFMRSLSAYPRIILLTALLSLLLIVFGSITPVAAQSQSSPVVEDSIELDGSTVTVAGGDVTAIGVSGIPDAYYPVSDLGSGTLQESDNGVIWQSGGNVSFMMTPPESAEAGDTVSLDVKIGSASPQTVTLDLVVSKIPPAVQQETVSKTGSTVTIVDDSSVSIGVQNIPDAYYPVSDLGSGTLQESDNGVIWQSGGNVSFTMTPPKNATPGDTVSFQIKRGPEAPVTETLEVVAVPEEANVEPDVFTAVADDSGSVDTFTLVDSIQDASDDGEVNGVEVSTFDFVNLIQWNSN
jgi:predicted secreted protein